MEQTPINSQLTELVKSATLGKALEAVTNYIYTHPHLRSREQLEAIRADYQLMIDYWQRGFDDEQRQQLYQQLRQRLFALATDLAVEQWVNNSPILSQMHTSTRKNRSDWSTDALRRDLECFVSNQAMLELEPEHTRAEKQQQLYIDRQKLAALLFDYILTTRSWSDSIEASFLDILTSPTIDVNDQQLLLTAVTLSTMNVFDFNKFRLLTKVYLKATDEGVRQRALVGWALTMDSSAVSVYPEMRQIIETLTADSHVCDELAELQIQMVYCMNTEKDRQTIEREIMPDLLRNGNFRLTSKGIEEIEDDPMEDILHPDAAEQRMEKMEESMRRMTDMQKSGSDIYFGGFSQMKRFPFFGIISNWFTPFYPEHPAVSRTFTKSRGRKFLSIFMKIGAFCNSDKYSFVLGFDQISSRLPEKILELMEENQLSFMDEEITKEDSSSPAYIRRMYLQDLYRFFKIYPNRSVFRNPFESLQPSAQLQTSFFFTQSLFRATPLEQQMTSIAAFLVKHKLHQEAAQVLDNCSEASQGYQYYMLRATVSSKEYYAKALELRPDSQAALRGYARAAYAQNDYDAALNAYERLLTLKPDTPSYMLGKAVCLTSLHRYADAQAILFQLNYNYPDDHNVERVLAWALMCDGKLAQAERIYERLTTPSETNTKDLQNEDSSDTQRSVDPEDLLNYGYCYWLSRHIDKAISCFRQYAEAVDDFDALAEFRQHEAHLLAPNGISSVEIQLMADQL